jgi:signal transduction histidine kinase
VNFKKEKTNQITAIVVTIVTAIVFSFLFLFLGINHRRDVYNDSKKLAIEISRKAAFEVQVYLSLARFDAKSIKEKVLILRKHKASRKEVCKILKSTIIEHPNYLGTWSLWEPDAFDSKDYLFKEDSFFNDDGTLGVGYFRYNDTIYYEVMTSADYIGPHYVPAKESRKEVLVEPFRFNYTGYKQIFFGTAVSVPIIDDNRFLGVIGIDIDLENVQKELNKIRPYETGYLSLISNNGTIVTHIDSLLIHKNIFELLNTNDTLSYNSIVNGKEHTFETISEFTHEKVLRIFYPIQIGEDNKPWSMMIEIPLNKAIARSRELLIIALITLFVGLSLLVYLIGNIVERKRYEKDLLAAKIKAEESDRLKTAFLNNISHEIRTPLNGILGFAELLTDEDTDERQAEVYKEIIQTSSNRLLSTISDVIELSKIQAHQKEVKLREFEVEKVIQKVAESYESEIEKKNLKLIKNYPKANNKSIITTDENKFEQVLSYLINNAIKFTAKGEIETGYYEKKDSYMFYVKDTGIGINPENAKNIFKYFNQEETTSIRKYEGLGIGLSISKSLVDILGGAIRFESEVGKGTTFYFSLPFVNK